MEDREQRERRKAREVARNQRIQMAIPAIGIAVLGLLIGIGSGGTMMPWCGWPGAALLVLALLTIASAGLGGSRDRG